MIWHLNRCVLHMSPNWLSKACISHCLSPNPDRAICTWPEGITSDVEYLAGVLLQFPTFLVLVFVASANGNTPTNNHSALKASKVPVTADVWNWIPGFLSGMHTSHMCTHTWTHTHTRTHTAQIHTDSLLAEAQKDPGLLHFMYITLILFWAIAVWAEVLADEHLVPSQHWWSVFSQTWNLWGIAQLLLAESSSSNMTVKALIEDNPRSVEENWKPKRFGKTGSTNLRLLSHK